MITLYKNFIYDNNYMKIKLFSSTEEQIQYFKALRKIVIDDTNYIKIGNTINVNIDYDELVSEGVNYLTYNNNGKEYYCFIVNKRYIRQDVTELITEIDVINTFMFDIELQTSFIERKKCNITDIENFDEGLFIGEHIVKSSEVVFEKEANYFAMMNGIKEQQLVFDSKGNVSNVVPLPFHTSKPLTIIDGIQYPLYFIPLKETYKEPSRTEILPPTNGSIGGGSFGTNIVNSARKLIGKPYVWGGNYPPLGNDEGTDCSGLCQWAFNDNDLIGLVGLNGRWTTYTMIDHKATNINLEQAGAGDLIFMNFQNGRPEHVAIIVRVDGTLVRIVEAQQTGVPILERDILYTSDMIIRRFL